MDYVIPLHCTGEPFYLMAKTEMRTKFVAFIYGYKICVRVVSRVLSDRISRTIDGKDITYRRQEQG